MVLCTLLGPEGPGRPLRWPIGPLDFVRLERFGVLVEEYRPYFENYTVDASILKDADEIERTSVCDGLSVSQIIQVVFGRSWVTHVISIF